MRIRVTFLQATLAATLVGSYARADDCTIIKIALLNSGTTPHSLIVTKTDGQGKQTVTRQIQTLDNKYIQTANGTWYAMNIGVKDLDRDTSGVLTCRRSGSDTIAGQASAIYEVHGTQEGMIQDQQMWVSPNNRILKTEGTLQGVRYTTQYDFSEVKPPTSSISISQK